MRVLTLTLAALIVLIQYPLWMGKGSWFRVWEVDQQIRAQRETNRRLQARNAALEAEVRDLKVGLDAIEERARAELGMIRQDEIFFQLLDPVPAAQPRDPAAR
ncbi:MAG TPA: cell division protein FtsB [Burkholderiales bacterium]|jgi:cell division protein FtsB